MTADAADARDPIAGQPAEDLEDIALRDDYALSPKFVAMVVDAADAGDDLRLRELLDAEREALDAAVAAARADGALLVAGWRLKALTGR